MRRPGTCHGGTGRDPTAGGVGGVQGHLDGSGGQPAPPEALEQDEGEDERQYGEGSEPVITTG